MVLLNFVPVFLNFWIGSTSKTSGKKVSLESCIYFFMSFVQFTHTDRWILGTSVKLWVKGQNFCHPVKLPSDQISIANFNCIWLFHVAESGPASLHNKQPQLRPAMISILTCVFPTHHSHHHHNPQFDGFGSRVTRAPHTGPRPASHCISLVRLFLSTLSFPNSSWHFYRMCFTHSFHKTTASLW